MLEAEKNKTYQKQHYKQTVSTQQVNSVKLKHITE